MARYLVGIDLGTTNSALAYIEPKRGREGEIKPFPIPQLVAPGEVKERPLLPSFLYLPGPHDLPAGAVALVWDPQRNYTVGEFARNHGGKVPGRLVSSAKSWLCHAGVDRSAPLLPWSAPPDVPRISPVEASARYLRHMVEAWNNAKAGDHDEDRLENQSVVLTVPASFDDVARNLTVEAAAKAGLKDVVLLEEPQAAFYCWLATHPAKEASKLKPGMRCLVVDVGGGTTDFSLIEAVEQEGGLGFVRQAVGDHLLLGGDNMDLALAKYVEGKMPGAGKLDAVQYGLLTQACRMAKETLLVPSPPASQTVTVVGRGRAVIGGSLHAPLSPAEVHKVICDGFFPVVPAGSEPARGARAGLHEMGLPYVSDPAITRHLSAFLKQQTHDRPPTAILFNGGVFTPAILRDRLLDVMKQWFGADWRPLVLTNPSLDLAVALGAAHYAWLRHTGGKRIGGGLARSYYVAIADAEREAASKPNSVTALCVVPQHLEEGHDIVLEKPELELALGQPVVFPLYTSTVRGEDKAGDVLRVRRGQLLQLPPLHTILRGGKRSGTKSVPVTLAARATAIGTLELFCQAKEGNNRWRLEFNVRDVVADEPEDDATEPAAPARAVSDVWPEHLVQEAARLIRETFTGPAPPQELTRALEAALDAPRHDWPMGLCRRLWEFLAEVGDGRRRSPSHLARWYNLVGYCLRPGFGDPLDRFRIEQLWKMVAAPPRSPASTAPKVAESGADHWIMWRRAAGGLNGTLQNALLERLRPALLPGKGKAVAKPGPNELAEMWRAAASLERIDPKQKEALGAILVKSARRSPVPTYAFWALTRFGARQLVYGPLNAVVHPQLAEAWLDAILPFQPGNQSERLAWAFCLAQLARKTGLRAQDVDDSHRQSVLTALRGQQVPEHWARMVAEVSELEQEEQGQMLGDALPIGLRLVTPSE